MKEFYINAKVSFLSFYGNIKTNFSDIDEQKLIELKKRGEEINIKHYKNKNLKPTKTQRYFRLMELINGNCKTRSLKNEFSTDSDSEKLLLFMYSVDPTLEAAIIYSSYNTINEVKTKFSSEFGIFDPYLVKVEKYFMNKFLNSKEKEQINEEIEKRAFK